MSVRHLAAGACGLAAMALVAGSAGGTTRYVSPSGSETGGYTNWSTAAKTIQKAVDACNNGDSVIVTNGVYSPTSQVSVTKGITVSSLNGAAATAIDGGGARRCLFLNASNAVVDGFTIRNGMPNSESIGKWYGGGVLIWTNGLVRNCIIASNTCNRGGGGVAMLRGGTVRNCLIVGNAAVATDWYGGGVYAQFGGTVESCTIVSNQNTAAGSGVCLDQAGGIVINSIIYQNTGTNNVSLVFGASGPVSYSCMTPLVAGTGNTTNNPLFASGYRLTTGSPCVDKGTNLAWMVGATDLDGKGRIQNGTVDMGAYELGFYIGLCFSAVDVTWDSAPGVTYQVQSSTNLLNPASWTNLGSSVTATNTSCYVPDWIRDSTGKSYRVLQLP